MEQGREQRVTPAIEQYLKIKAEYPDCILLFRMGDFYEMFYEDAVVASRILDIVLTSRDKQVPMAGFPHHAAENYIIKLVKEGFKVAICEQLEDASKAKKIIKRGVVRVITPGLVTELSFVSPDENNYIAVINKNSLLWADITTGEIKARIFADQFELAETIKKLSPKEILGESNEFPEFKFTKIDIPTKKEAEEEIRNYFSDQQDFEKMLHLPDEIISSFTAIVRYIKNNIKDIDVRLGVPEIESVKKVLSIDTRTFENIEVFKTYEGKKGSLLWVLDKTETPMGKRKLKNLLQNPLCSKDEILLRLDAVEELFLKKGWEKLDLEGISDIERLSIRVLRKIANPKEVVALKNSVIKITKIKNLLSDYSAKLIRTIYDSIPDLTDFVYEVERCIVDDPPFKASDGAIKDGVDEELDRIRRIKENSERILKEFEDREKQKANIPLKVGYNQVFGYYIEVSKVHADKVPPYYIRKQTLSSAERFTTEELDKIGIEIEGASEMERKLNEKVYSEFLERIQKYIGKILEASRAIGFLDVLVSFAKCAYLYDWVRPEITDDKIFYVKDGRHPSLEILLREKFESFVPNSCELDEENFMWIITGPNMAGKSVFLKQCALIGLLAHIGSFVPAKEAKIGLIDKIFFRTGASDDIARGRSTFFVEMEELSQILKGMTERSFVILDEVGRGTSTFDGICIAWATAEYINRKGSRCLFATHFHELSFLEDNLDGVRNMHFSAEKIGGNLVFVRRIKKGAAGRSWGIDVARLAGIPYEIIEKAEKILIAMEQGKIGEVIKKIANTPFQLSIFGASSIKQDPIRRELKKVDINKITPVEALTILSELKKMAE